MKATYILFLFILFTSCTSTLYIVRHAEKSTEPKNNPHLTEAGKERAMELAKILKRKKIRKIYSTNTNRTIETATPLSLQQNKMIQVYSNDTLDKLFYHIFTNKRNTLVVGHSNTVLKMLEIMGLHGKVKVILDNEYNNLFKIKVKRYCHDCAGLQFRAKLHEQTYGKPPIMDTISIKK